MGYVWTLTGPNIGPLGSGTLIDPYWVITAGHMFDSAGILETRFGLGTDFVNDWQSERVVSEVYVHPGHIPSPNGGRGVDLALIRLSEPITDQPTVDLFRGSLEIGQVVQASGFGRSGTPETGGVINDAKKRAGENRVEQFGSLSVDPHFVELNYEFPHQPEYLPLEWGGWFGDSGGGYFVQEDDIWELAAVHSFATGDGYLNNSGGVMVEPFLPWIDSIMMIPEPASLVLLGFGMVLIARRNVGRR